MIREYFVRFIIPLFVLLIIQGCSLSGSIKTHKSENPLTPPSTPVVGEDGFVITQPTDYVGTGNTNSYPLSGTCKSGDQIQVKVNSVVAQTVECTNGQFSINLDLSSQGSGYITIEAEVTGGDSSQQTSVQILKDVDAPTLIGSVTDGTYYNSTTRTPTLTWTAGADSHSGIAKYQIAVGTTLGGTEVVSWTDGSATASGYVSGLTLSNGTTYYASVRVVDGAGNISVIIQSDGWIVDANAPTLATNFLDGVLSYSATHSPLLSWTASTDAGSGVSGYQVALGTAGGGNNILDWTSLGNVTSATLSSLNLAGNQRIYSSIRTVDQAGNTTNTVQGDGWWNFRQTKKTIDATTPEARALSEAAKFGYAVAISSDETTLAVGAYADDLDANGANYMLDAGAVFIYVKSGGNWVFQQKIVATGVNARVIQDQFGSNISLNGDTLAVGVNSHRYNAAGAGTVSNSGAVFVYTRTGGVWSLQEKIVATGINARNNGDSFGSSVSVEQDTLAIGAESHAYDATGANPSSGAGAVFIYTRTSGVWSLQQKIVAGGVNARAGDDTFGNSVSLYDQTLAVGSSMNSYNVAGAGSVHQAGAVYVFTRSGSTWSQQQKLIPTGTNARGTNDYFGQRVSLYADTLAVTSAQNRYDASGNNPELTGAVFVFTRSGSVWSQQQKLVSSGVNSRVNAEAFGRAISLGNDRLLIGAVGQHTDSNGTNEVLASGALYYFSRSAGTWSLQQKIVPTGVNARSEGNGFGIVALAGATAVVGSPNDHYNAMGTGHIFGAGSAHVFNFNGSSWVQDTKLVDPVSPASRMDLLYANIGQAVTISDDGLTLAITGDNSDSNGHNYLSMSGSVLVYVKSGGNWVFQQKLVPTGTNARNAQDKFGSAISISQDTIAVGAQGHVYDENGSNATMAAGAVFVYTRSAGVWTQQQKIIATGTNARNSDDYFGASVSIYENTLAVGTSFHDYDELGDNYLDNTGAVFVYTRSGSTWSQQQKIVATGTNARDAYDSFGSAISLYHDTLAVGSPYHDYDLSGAGAEAETGAAFIYTRSGSTWTQQQKIIASGLNARVADDNFGYSISLYADTVAVGALKQSYDAVGTGLLSSAGAVFVYTRSGSTWSQQQKIVPTGTNSRRTDDTFGTAISLSANSLVVGSPLHNFNESGTVNVNDGGAAFVFNRQAATWTQSLKLVPTGTQSRAAFNNFGGAVALSENGASDGYSIIIGNIGDDYDSNGVNPATDAGSAYIFD